jgi:Phosphoenolpyruvate phosphomutase
MASEFSQVPARFPALHSEGCVVLPNVWDVGIARLFQHLGFSGIASTSTGYAWSEGCSEDAVSREDALSHLASLTHSVSLPVNADFQVGFAEDPEGVAESVTLVATGVAGLSIEDRDIGGRGSTTLRRRRNASRPHAPESTNPARTSCSSHEPRDCSLTLRQSGLPPKGSSPSPMPALTACTRQAFTAVTRSRDLCVPLRPNRSTSS